MGPAPAFATNGRQAVGMCIEQSGCSWQRNKDGSILILSGGDNATIITCPSAEAECKVAIHRSGKPGGKLPVQTIGSTAGRLARP